MYVYQLIKFIYYTRGLPPPIHLHPSCHLLGRRWLLHRGKQEKGSSPNLDTKRDGFLRVFNDSTSSDLDPSEPISAQCWLDSSDASIFVDPDVVNFYNSQTFQNNNVWCIKLSLSFIWCIWGWSVSHAALAMALPVGACPSSAPPNQQNTEYSLLSVWNTFKLNQQNTGFRIHNTHYSEFGIHSSA